LGQFSIYYVRHRHRIDKRGGGLTLELPALNHCASEIDRLFRLRSDSRSKGVRLQRRTSQFSKQGLNFTVLRSQEVNLSPEGVGDMKLLRDLVLGCFYLALRTGGAKRLD
jgi:hypothetical protein